MMAYNTALIICRYRAAWVGGRASRVFFPLAKRAEVWFHLLLIGYSLCCTSHPDTPALWFRPTYQDGMVTLAFQSRSGTHGSSKTLTTRKNSSHF